MTRWFDTNSEENTIGWMFRTLHSYKDQDFYAEHDTVYLDTLYRSGAYSIFAVLNMIDGEWDPSTAMFMDDEAFIQYTILSNKWGAVQFFGQL